MEQKKRATEAAPIQNLTGAKVRQEKDIEKVLDYFRYTVGTTLDCMFATGVLRNCISNYSADIILSSSHIRAVIQLIFI